MNLENRFPFRKLSRLYRRYFGAVGGSGSKFDFHTTYPQMVRGLMATATPDRAMELAVGGDFKAVGILERELLILQGLAKDAYVIDVGCGSGRLALPLSEYLSGRYLGIDVVPELLDHARRRVGRPDWRFESAAGLSIPEAMGKADMVCFFSVFTHLLHEQSYVYLEEARRVLKTGGKIVFSFLEFPVAEHWQVFQGNVQTTAGTEMPLNMFIGRDAIAAWATHLNLKVECMFRGDEAFIPLPHRITFDDGRVMEGKGSFWQSVCVLSKPAD